MRTSDNLTAWKVLSVLSRGGGLTQAAVETDLDPAQCTRLIQRLETELGVALVTHKSRPVLLTALGNAILSDLEAMLKHHERIRQMVAAHQNQIVTLTFSIPTNTPRESSFKIMHDHLAVNPQLRFSVVADADHEDVINGMVDLAYLPYTPAPTPNLAIFPLGCIFNCLVASPTYLDKHGYPVHPKDLVNHAVILRTGRHYPKTTFLERGMEKSPLIYANAYEGDALSDRLTAISGDGIAIDLAYAMVRQDIAEGRLVPVLKGWHRPVWHPSLVYLNSHPQAKRLEHFARFFQIQESKQITERLHDIQQLHASSFQSTHS